MSLSGLAGLVDRDEPLLEDPDRFAETLLEVVEARLRLLQLGLLLAQLGGDGGPAVSQRRHL